MTSNSAQMRVRELLDTADEATKAGENAKAGSILREASQVDPQNEEVKKHWFALAGHEAGGRSPVGVIRAYLKTRDVSDGDKAQHALNRQRQLTATEAVEAYDLLTRSGSENSDDGPLPRLDGLTGLLIQRHTLARQLIASRLTSSPTEIFEQLYNIGDESFKAIFPVVLDETLWPSDGKARVTAQQDIFRLSLATLIEAGIERPERAMRAITNMLAVQPQSVVTLIDQDVVDIVLTGLDLRLPSDLRRQAMLATSRMLEVTGEQGEEFFATCVKARVAKGTNHDLILAFSAASAVFPILPQVAAKLFLTEGFVRELVPNLERNSEATAHGKRYGMLSNQRA